MYSKTLLKRPLSKRLKLGFQDQLSLNAGQTYCGVFCNTFEGELSAICLAFIKLPFAIKIIRFVYFERPLKTGFTVLHIDFDLSNDSSYQEINCFWRLRGKT